MKKREPKKIRNSFMKVFLEWRCLDFTNKVLVFVGLFLLFELIFTIIRYGSETDVTTDAFFRLTLSSVIGYFLGSSSGTNIAPTDSGPVYAPRDDDDAAIYSNDSEFNLDHTSHLRTFFVAVICVVSLVTLFLTNFYLENTYEEGMTQLRNIISLTIGFLISKGSRAK